LGRNLSLAPCRVQPRDRWTSLIDGLSNQPLNTKSRKSAIASPSTFSDPLIVRGSEVIWFGITKFIRKHLKFKMHLNEAVLKNN
jgi:hypothetical protein